MLILIFFWLAHTFSVTLKIHKYVFSVNDMPHVSRPNLEDASQSHINVLIALMSCRAWQYVVIVMIKNEITFFQFVTTFTTLWSRDKVFCISHYINYTSIKEKKVFFHLVTTFTRQWSREKKVFYHLVTTFTTP